MNLEKEIETLCLDKCAWSDECNFCENPQEGSYARITGYEYREVEYVMCGKCIRKYLDSPELKNADEMRKVMFLDKQEKTNVNLPF